MMCCRGAQVCIAEWAWHKRPHNYKQLTVIEEIWTGSWTKLVLGIKKKEKKEIISKILSKRHHI